MDHPVYLRLPERQFRTIRYATGRRKNNSLQGKQDNRVFRSWFKELELIIARYCGPRWPSTIRAVDGLRDMLYWHGLHTTTGMEICVNAFYDNKIWV